MSMKASIVSFLFGTVTVLAGGTVHASLTGGEPTSQPSLTLWAGNVQGMSISLSNQLSDSSDGALHPLENQLLSSGSDGVFNFSSLYIPEGVTLEVVRNGYQGVIYLLGAEDIVIDGLLREIYGPLVIRTTAGVNISGTIQSPLIAISANRIFITGSIDTSVTTVPLPGAFGLLGAGLGALAFVRRVGRKLTPAVA